MFKRLRRVRLNSVVRNLVEENTIRTQDLIYPLFITHGTNIKNAIASMPDVYQLSIDNALEECAKLESLGINAVMLFGIPAIKDSTGSEALSEQGIIAQALRAIKEKFPNLLLCVDLCFCEYTDHGHCGILNPKLQSVDNDLTLEILNKQAIVLAQSGADLIAPSGMMDGMIESLRTALDNAGFSHLPIMSYSTKFASGYYGPFRDVAQSTPSFGDRKSYQQNPANRREAIAESLEDEAQGADILMVKPALAYLDIVRDIRERSLLPLAVYNVSGEYAMLKFAQKAGLIDYERVLMETMLSFKRAGADIIITYHAKEIAKLLKLS
ncbi:porphobilinogen synthase [Helicobacter sp. MIT 11-5569]|uniref:porphobilinogen synthase n=1 Tax=Helicobacter sp. MIT 11-5569 TaxID=1548151 RepID=UPI00051FC9FE|nr:porphobilinogen synthase [Helicobacter sp. MIT 11-5569]TLD81244.1 porphobilinogen synthase [Helicobacter sp. MIT 11-5569]